MFVNGILSLRVSTLDGLRPDVHCVTVQLDKVEVHELKPKMLTKDEGVLIHYQSRTNV